MRFSKKRRKNLFILSMCILSLLSPGTSVYAVNKKEIQKKSEKSDKLKKELQDVNQDIQELAGKIAQVEVSIEKTEGEIEKTKELLLIAQNSEQKQYDDMKMRIKYLYENDDNSLIEMVLTAENMNDLLTKVDFVQSINIYDRDKLKDLTDLKETITEQQSHLEEEQASQQELKKELSEQKAELTAKAKETSTDLTAINNEIEELKEQQRREAEEKARKEAEEAAKKAAEEAKKAEQAKKAETKKAKKNTSNSQKKKSDKNNSTPNKSGTSSNSSGGYTMPSGDGVLTKSKGVVYYKGHKETYYSQRVLPGNGLKIPGRHVASDGTIRDKDNYICVASSDYPKGTIVDTSLGTGKVYDSGCASGTIDIYTDW